MGYELEQIIDTMKDSLDYIELGYSGGFSIDTKYCPICGADEIIKYQTNQVISMDTLEHADDCAHTLIRKLEEKLN